MSPVNDELAVQILALPQPRPLTSCERELLDFLLAGPVNSPELRAQAKTAEVNGVRSCGCPSIQFAVEEAAPRALLDGPEVVATGGAEIRAVGVVEGLETGVTLHIVGDVLNGEGVIWELETWPTAHQMPSGRFCRRSARFDSSPPRQGIVTWASVRDVPRGGSTRQLQRRRGLTRLAGRGGDAPSPGTALPRG